MHKTRVLIIDYGRGNLFSVERALRYVGAEVVISSNYKDILEADHLVLPGVGAFADAMAELRQRNLIEAIISFANSKRPLLGICLGMQLLMSQSEEFGMHKGLDLVSGEVVRLKAGKNLETKIPHIGWKSLSLPRHKKCQKENKDSYWKNTILEGVNDGSFVYFVHSYVAVPADHTNILAETEYGENTFCSALRKENIFACQFHPERSGKVGLEIYRRFLLM